MITMLKRIWTRIKQVYSRPATRGDARFGPTFGTI